MSYSVKEIFYTLQGEGAHTGRAAVFCRFAGCNLWTGREEDRHRAICRFCDTDFLGTDGEGGARFEDAARLGEAVARTWRGGGENRFVVLTGGEPVLQIDEALLDELRGRGFEIAIETNGTVPVPAGIDWICVSPKAGTEIVVRSGDELKLVYPQEGAEPEQFEGWDFTHFFLQPMDSPEKRANTEKAVEYCMKNPLWRLSIQSHKILGIP